MSLWNRGPKLSQTELCAYILKWSEMQVSGQEGARPTPAGAWTPGTSICHPRPQGRACSPAQIALQEPFQNSMGISHTASKGANRCMIPQEKSKMGRTERWGGPREEAGMALACPAGISEASGKGEGVNGVR